MLDSTLRVSFVFALAFFGCKSEEARPPSNASSAAHVASTSSRGMTSSVERKPSYVDVPTRYVEVEGRRIAYRRVGTGQPIVLCNRFRGILDSWDPAFIDGLAAHFDVVTFDYSGLGLSSGGPPSDIKAMAKDVNDLAHELGIQSAVVVGWSLGGLVAQTVLSRYPRLVHHLVLIGTLPPGKPVHPAEPVFLERAHNTINDLDDEVVLFFEPASPASVRAARLSHERIARRTRDLSVPVPPSHWDGLHRAAWQFLADEAGVRSELMRTTTPILVMSGDHDVSCPVENWYALSRSLPTTQFVVFPRSGHGPQHEHVVASVDAIVSFVRNTR
jgi:pimeloyl-ACP methyl ester carboxylesterase